MSRSIARKEVVAWAALCAAYVAARLWSYAHVFGHRPPLQPDSFDYLRGAALSLTDSRFWTFSKPWALPLLYKLLPGSTQVAIAVQFAIATVAWIVLAVTLARVLHRRVPRLLALCAVLLFALTPLVAQWDGQLLTESLSNSLTALLVAAAIVFVRSPGRLRLLLVVAAAFGATMTRDTNGYLALLVLVPLGLAIVRRGRPGLGAGLAVAAVLIFALQTWSYDVRRWHGPMQDVIAQRVLPVPGALRYFRDRGMPVRPGLGAALIANRVPPTKFDNAPRLAYFRPWFEDHARQTYLGYLLTHPGVSVGKPVRRLDILLAPSRPPPYGLDYFRRKGYRDPLPGLLIRAFYPQQGWAVLAAMIAALLLAAGFWRARLAEAVWLVPALLLLAAVPLAIIVYNGDAIGIDRHSLLVGVTARLGVIMLGAMLLDAVSLAADQTRSRATKWNRLSKKRFAGTG